MGELLLIGAVAMLLQELINQILDKLAWRKAGTLNIQAKSLAVRFFTIITFPLVIFMSLVAALWLLPYLLLAKPYRAQLAKAHGQDHASGWQSLGSFSSQLSDISTPQFMLMPFKPVFSFMDWLAKKRVSARKPQESSQLHFPASAPHFIPRPTPSIRP